MDQTRSLRVLGIVFLACGASFLAIGAAVQTLVFTVLGPSFMGLGVVFLATSRGGGKSPPKGTRKAQVPGDDRRSAG